MAAADGVGLVMNMDMRIVRPHDQPIHVVRAEMKDAGFAMIDPYDAMMMSRHG